MIQQALRNLDIDSTVKALQLKLQVLAHAEYERQRRRLGQLTPEQETAIKALLQSTVNEISHPVINCIRCSCGANEAENMQSWRDTFELAD